MSASAEQTPEEGNVDGRETDREELERLRRENEWFRAAHMLIAEDEAFVSAPDKSPFWYVEGKVAADGTPLLWLNMNDTFMFACADAEPFSYEDAPTLLKIAKAEGWDGLTRWASEKRGQQPIPPVVKRMEEHEHVYDRCRCGAEQGVTSVPERPSA